MVSKKTARNESLKILKLQGIFISKFAIHLSRMKAVWNKYKQKNCLEQYLVKFATKNQYNKQKNDF